MTSFVIEAKFPAGVFLAHGPHGYAEWPPSPARLAKALLATAYRQAQGVATARDVFSLPPPVIATPRRGLRDVEVRRWVPVDVEVSASGRTGRGGKLAKPPERGSTVGNGVVEFQYRWDGEESGFAGWLTELAQLAHAVPYLGRPTSPVLLTVRPGNVSRAGGLWRPDPNGAEQIDVATPELLRALDLREAEREKFGLPGLHPRYAQPTHGYHAPGARAASDLLVDVEALLQRSVTYRTPGADPLDLLDVMRALNLPDGLVPVPVLEEESTRGLARSRLTGVAVVSEGRGGLGAPAQALARVGGTPLVLRPSVARGTQALRRALAASWGTSQAWTTVVPVAADPVRLRAEICALAGEVESEVVDATTHDVPRPTHAPDVGFHPGLTHVSILFDRPVTGHLFLGEAAMTSFPHSNPETTC